MEFYIKVSFWLGVVCFVIRIVSIAVLEFPHEEKVTMGGFVARTILGLAVTIWLGILLYMR